MSGGTSPAPFACAGRTFLVPSLKSGESQILLRCAVDGVSLAVVAEGENLGLIGPNGAGKTTTMECVKGMRPPDRGVISILGLDPFRDVDRLPNRIGVRLKQAPNRMAAGTPVWFSSGSAHGSGFPSSSKVISFGKTVCAVAAGAGAPGSTLRATTRPTPPIRAMYCLPSSS